MCRTPGATGWKTKAASASLLVWNATRLQDLGRCVPGGGGILSITIPKRDGGLSTFRRGHIWRVSTGEMINIWEDHWVPGSPSRMIQTPRGNTLLQTVNELIDPATRTWDEVLLRDIFSPIDVHRILSIPLSAHLHEDFIAWHYTKSYIFLVRSVYYIEWDHSHRHRLTQADGQGPSERNPV